jgi:nitronate monooxygenase
MSQGGVTAELYRGLRLPIFAAPMFLISGPDLVIAAGRAGIIGAMPAPNARTIEDVSTWLQSIARELRAPEKWAINMIVHKSYERFDAELDLICEYKPPIVITALGSPARPLERVHNYGGVVFADVVTPEQARKAVDAGADGLILVAFGAGGHTGRYSPFAFVDEVRSFWSGPLVLAGAIGSGHAIRATLALGADFAYVGTRFIAARESLVSEANREMLVRATISDIVTTSALTGVPSNWMRESLDRAGFTPQMLKEEKKVDFSDLHGDTKLWKNIWGAGQSVGRTRSIQSVREIVDELYGEFNAEASSRIW